MSGRGKKEDQKTKRQNRNVLIFAIVMGLVIIVGTLSILVYRSGALKNTKSAVTIDGTGYKLCEFNYYYYAYYNAYIDENSQYIDYMFDESESLKNQKYDENQTWHDYFVENAKDSMVSVITAAKEAQAADFTISEEAQATIDENVSSIEAAAERLDKKTDAYLEMIYGSGMTEKLYKKHQEYSYLASEYGDALKAKADFSEEEIQNYFDENSAKYTFVSYERFYVKASEVDTQPTQEQKDQAYETAQKILERYKKGEALKTVSADFEAFGTYYSFEDAYYDASFSYGDWLFSEERKDGDSEIIDDGSGYYVMVFHSRTAGDYTSADIIDLCFTVDLTALDNTAEDYEEQKNQLYEDSCTKAEEIKAQWDKSSQTEENFREITANCEDVSAADQEYQNLTKNTLDSSLEKWIFNAQRKTGDCSVIYTQDGFHVVYYVKNGEPAWKAEAEEDLRTDAFNKWYQGLLKNANVKESKYVLGFAGGENE